MMMPTRYYLSLPDGRLARGDEPSLSFSANGGEAFAAQLQDALRTDALFERWRALQDEPDEVDMSLGVVDPAATVEGQQDDLHIDLVATTSLPGTIVRHRMRLLAGSHWQLRDVTRA
ncbi:hypothetical protein GCM10027359_26970 [Marilutibacter aestuarii]